MNVKAWHVVQRGFSVWSAAGEPGACSETAALNSSFTFLWHFRALWSNTEKSWLKPVPYNKLSALLSLLWAVRAVGWCWGMCSRQGVPPIEQPALVELSCLGFGLKNTCQTSAHPECARWWSKESCLCCDLPKPESPGSCLGEMM